MIGNIAAGLYGVGVAPSTNSYESISTTTVGAGGSATVSFTSIPSTYKHLQIRILSRTDRASSAGDGGLLTFNSDTGTNYAYHYIQGDGASATAGGTASNNSIIFPRSASATQTSGIFGVGIIDILDYTNTNKYKTVRTLGGNDANGSGIVAIFSGLWMNTAAITSITLDQQNGPNWVQYSSFALYGIKD
jgi:hypothetical protein